MRAHIVGACATVILAALCVPSPAIGGEGTRAPMFNPAATLDTSQVRDRRAYDWTSVHVIEGWTCTEYYSDWSCIPPGMTV